MRLSSVVQEVLGLPGAADLLTVEDLSGACGDADLVKAVDAVVEAAYEPGRVLRRLHDQLRQDAEQGMSEAASSQLRALSRKILDEVTAAFRLLCPEQERFAVVPRSSGAVSLLAELCTEPAEEEGSGRFPAGLRAPEDAGEGYIGLRGISLVAWRLLLADQQGLERVDLDAPASEVLPHLHLGSWLSPGPADAPRFFDWVEKMLDDLPLEGAVLVLGPAELMLDGLTGELEGRRRDLLVRSAAADGSRVDTPLRWAAALPTRLVGHGGRQPLALWLFAVDSAADPAADATLFSTYHDLTGPGTAAAAASDAAAAVLGREGIRRHG